MNYSYNWGKKYLRVVLYNFWFALSVDNNITIIETWHLIKRGHEKMAGWSVH